ncbi:MAG: exodeoxyribonuclease VII large subunit [Lachnospiraceae bacterium]|jgi:exodeoxyribonuclease VII large subunit|nr:exodeoxyribonuclease VII large subunit [Lachnospiraceae bacterium]
MAQNVYTVAQVNSYIKNMFTQDYMLQSISVKGEVSNCKYHTSGHIYFTLKDLSGTIACVMFAGSRSGLAFRLAEGQQVVVTGRIDVYERDGKYQLYAQKITRQGIGDLYVRYEQLKRELEERGMFAAEYKRSIPKYIKTLGVVTAQTGAAVRDIINIAHRRNPYVQIILYPAIVQGEAAVPSIINGLNALEALGVDVIIAGRGGGSIEDLWAFNEESVAEAIFECKVPVISAVGHETDTTIADFVADLRAPTPSAAAELAVYDIRELSERLYGLREMLRRGMDGKLREASMQLQNRKTRLRYLSPLSQIREKRNFAMKLEEALQDAMERKITEKRQEMLLYVERMKGLSPLEKLRQGYSYVASEQGKTLVSVEQVKPGERLKIYVTDGFVEAEAIRAEKLKY